jgi:DNA-binding beta-propeller fold protein YncE
MKFKLLVILLLSISIFSVFGSELNYYSLSLKISPLEYDLYIDRLIQKPQEIVNNIREYSIPSNTDMFFLRSEGYHDKFVFLQSNPNFVEIKMERMDSLLEYQDLLLTGSQPKSVEFSGDGKYIAVALLNGGGVEIYSLDNMELFKTLNPPIEWSVKKGFVETVFFETRDELWVSQMTTGMIHVFDTYNWKYKLSFDCGGLWPKVITLNKSEVTAYISNWTSKNISIINTLDYSITKTIPVNGIPRGMAISPNEKYLYVGNFTSGDINKIDITKNTIVSVLNLKTDSVIKTFYAGSNINTIKLSPDGQKLFISSRGHNNENGYLQKGPDFGKIFVYDTVTKAITDWTWGGNQPTGLAISPDGSILAFTDFLDYRVEIYRIEP